MAARKSKRSAHKWTTKKPTQPPENASKSRWTAYAKAIKAYKWTQNEIRKAKGLASTSATPARRPRTKKKARRR